MQLAASELNTEGASDVGGCLDWKLTKKLVQALPAREPCVFKAKPASSLRALAMQSFKDIIKWTDHFGGLETADSCGAGRGVRWPRRREVSLPMSNVLQKAICVVVGSLHCCMFVLATLYFRSCSLPSCRVITFCAHFHWQAFSFWICVCCVIVLLAVCGLTIRRFLLYFMCGIWLQLSVSGAGCVLVFVLLFFQLLACALCLRVCVCKCSSACCSCTAWGRLLSMWEMGRCTSFPCCFRVTVLLFDCVLHGWSFVCCCSCFACVACWCILPCSVVSRISWVVRRILVMCFWCAFHAAFAWVLLPSSLYLSADLCGCVVSC